MTDDDRQAQEDIDRLKRAVTVACEWFACHEYTGDGLNVLQVLREVSSPTEIAKAKAAEARVLADTIRGARRQETEECAREAETRDDGAYSDVQRGMARLIAMSIRSRALPDEKEPT